MKCHQCGSDVTAKKLCDKEKAEEDESKYRKKFVMTAPKTGNDVLTPEGAHEAEKYRENIIRHANVGPRGRCYICNKKVTEGVDASWFSIGLTGQHHTCPKHCGMGFLAINSFTEEIENKFK